MNKYLVLVLSLLGCLVFTQAKAQAVPADSLSLDQAIDNVLQNQPSLDQIKAEVDAAQAQVQEAHAGYYPQVDANADYSHIDPVPSFTFANGGSVDIAPYNNYNFNVSIAQQIYDFGRTKSNIELAQSKMLTTKDRSQVVKWTLSYYTAHIFNSILFLEHSMEVEDEQISTLKHDLDLVKKRQESGAATNYDLLTTKVQIATEQNRKTDLENEREQQIINLRKLMGWDQSRPVSIKGDLVLKDSTLENVLPPVDLKNRPDYQLLQDKKDFFQQQYQLARTIEKPSLNAMASAGFKDGYPKDLNRLYGNWVLGVNLKVPLFSGYRSRYQQQAAKANLRSVTAQENDLQRNIQSQVASASSDFESAKKKLNTANLQIEQAREQIKLARLRYENGVITSQDLLDSETKLAQARLQRLNYIYKMIMSRYDLDKALGKQIW